MSEAVARPLPPLGSLAMVILGPMWASGCMAHQPDLAFKSYSQDQVAGLPDEALTLDSYSECVKKHPESPDACGGPDPESAPDPTAGPKPKRPPRPLPPPPPPELNCRLSGSGGGATWSNPRTCFYECPPGTRPQICKIVRGYEVPCPGPLGVDIPFSEIKELDDCD